LNICEVGLASGFSTVTIGPADIVPLHKIHTPSNEMLAVDMSADGVTNDTKHRFDKTLRQTIAAD
jgi:hypothetical protein